MRDLSQFRRYELVFVLSTAAIYVVRRLVEEVNRIDGLIGLSASGNGIAAGTFWRDITNYNHTLNNNIPLIAGVCLFLSAWYVFHDLAYPKLQLQLQDQSGWMLTGAAALLLLTTAFVYHYLKLYVRYQHNQVGDIIGIATYSLYRKRTVLADAVGLAIVLGTYEILFQYYHYLSRKMTGESAQHFRLVSYLLLAGLCVQVIVFVFRVNNPLPLWDQRPTRNALMLSGIGIQVIALQYYLYAYIIPLLNGSQRSETILLRRVGVYLVLLVVGTLILWGAMTWGGMTKFHYKNSDSILLLFVVLIGSISVAYGRQALTKEKTVLQTQVSAKSAELASLQAQINPHFLFNALNSLYATALKENGEKTADGIQKLGDMMRFMLQENNRDRIPLDKEVEYLHNYIEIQRMRIDETHNIEIRVTIQEPNRPIYIAPMMLTPFVENAFKHGISFRHPSWIYITLTLDATRLYFKVHNTRHARPVDTPDQQDPEKDQSGVGLDNVRKRLDLIYPGRHQLDIQQSEQDYFVSLTLVYW